MRCTSNRMLARIATFNLKPGMLAAFNDILERDVLPLVRKQRGFVTATTVCDSPTIVKFITAWADPVSLQKYHHETYQRVWPLFVDIMDGPPTIALERIHVPLGTISFSEHNLRQTRRNDLLGSFQEVQPVVDIDQLPETKIPPSRAALLRRR